MENQGNQEGKTVEVKIVNLPSTLPHKWDLADKAPDGLDVQEILGNSRGQIAPGVDITQHNVVPLTNERQKDQSIVNYLEAQMASKDNAFWMNAKTEALIRSSLEVNPEDALKTWQYITNSYSHSFIPMTHDEMQLKTQEANGLIESQKSTMDNDTYNKLKETTSTNPEEVIQHFRMVQMQRDLECSSDIRKFTELAKEYTQLPSYIRNEDHPIAKELRDISSRYLTDEKFNRAIEGNDLTKSVQKDLSTKEMAENKQAENTITEMNRGFER